MAAMLKFLVTALVAVDVAHAWSCPAGYAGPSECAGGHCNGNDVVVGSSDGDCCDTCDVKNWNGNAWQYDINKWCALHGDGQCCNCWRWTGRRLNATEAPQEQPSLRGSGGARPDAGRLGNDIEAGNGTAADQTTESSMPPATAPLERGNATVALASSGTISCETPGFHCPLDMSCKCNVPLLRIGCTCRE